MPSGCRVYSIAPGGDFLQVLAREINSGFPFAQVERQKPALPNWTILLPTRRAARALGSILGESSGRNALLLPNIKPIGDFDEGRFQDVGTAADIPAAISSTGQLFIMLNILKNWAAQNPHAKITAEIEASQIQSLGLANSLLQLVDQMETGETNLDQLSEAYNVELSDHRTALLNLLGLLKIDLPKKLLEEGLMGPAARRSLLIRLEATRISQSKFNGPIIAAGSTGTIPATRALLTAIARHPQGAVVLPGLDLGMGNEDWSSIGPDHPQFSLQNLIMEMDLDRRSIVALGGSNVNREFVSRELMRPSNSAENWHVVLAGRGTEIADAMKSVQIIKAPDRHLEARAIALVLREALEIPNQTAALVTPDRDLAQRVKTELLRWDIDINDTAGEPLHLHGIASLAFQILQAVVNGLTSADLLSILSHPNCTLGLPVEQFIKNLRNLEIAVLRSYGTGRGFQAILLSLARALEAKRTNLRSHALVASLADEDWSELQKFVKTLDDAFNPLFQSGILRSEQHLAKLEVLLNLLAPEADWMLPENQSLAAVLEELHEQAFRLADGNFSTLAPIILHVLRQKTFHSTRPTHPRLAIYGVLEARLIPSDILILGGLNEGRWPAQPDAGPWLNRPMRTLFGMPLPEREIGVSAHDFTQGLGYGKVFLTCSKRLDGAPQIPSRWLLRLQTVIQAAGHELDMADANSWVDLAIALDASPVQKPHEKPKPKPPREARPTSFSVTEVEKLIRDPYAIYARRILRVEPLQDLARPPDAALRGVLYHEALKIWNQQQAFTLSDNAFELLLQIGEKLFEPLRSDPEISAFWWARFIRIAAWVAAEEPNLRQNAGRIFAEINGKIEFEILNVPHRLTAKADRVDVLKNGNARIIDYKSGIPPTEKTVHSGISPQLPLEAAILRDGGFAEITSKSVSELQYHHLKGAVPAGARIDIDPEDNKTLDNLADKHLQGFKLLLAKYQNISQPYFPRAAIQKEVEKTDFDHLSRYNEWVLAGEA